MDNQSGARGESQFSHAEDKSAERALFAIVRRVLRTQSQRTRLDRLVMQAARSVNADNPHDVSQTSLIATIVQKLQRQLPRGFGALPAANAASDRFADSPTVAFG